MIGQAAALVGKPFVDFDVQIVGGGTGKLSDYVGKGKKVVVDMYTSWCALLVRTNTGDVRCLG